MSRLEHDPLASRLHGVGHELPRPRLCVRMDAGNASPASPERINPD